MAKNKEKGLKDFLIAERKKIGAGLGSAPVWVLQKAGRRIFSPKSRRNWSETKMGKSYRKRVKKGKK